MAQLIEKARKRLAVIEAEAEEIRTFLRVYAALEGENPVDNDSQAEVTKSDAEAASPAEVVESARALMKERGRPLTRSQLVKGLREKGLNLPGKDAAKNIGTVIWRSKQFNNIPGEGYWPKDFHGWMGGRPAEPEASFI